MSMHHLLNRQGNSPPISYSFDATIKKTPQEMIDARWPLSQPDRFAIIAYVDEPQTSRFFLRIFSLHSTQRQAEAAAKEAMDSGYNFLDLIVVDIRAWLPFPPAKFESTKQANEVLSKIMDQNRVRSVMEQKELKTRVDTSKPTTPFLKYQEFVLQEAKKLIKAMEGGDKQYLKKLEADFKEYQSLAQKTHDERTQAIAKGMDLESVFGKESKH
jgi:hypothetical protein